ncbi:hypothetical protein U2P60_02805 [Brucella sp. H1_1004]|uniref:hypothetical protein n=1 Tax=Brucella sp. H1_1004 TaxID=3110109 RepID=UPI0039B61D51
MKKLNPTEARQGKEGKPVLIILLISLAAAAVVWIGIEIFGNAIEPEDPANSEQTVPPASTN